MNLRIVMLLMTLLKKNRLKNNYTLRLVFDYRKEDLEQLWEHGRQSETLVRDRMRIKRFTHRALMFSLLSERRPHTSL